MTVSQSAPPVRSGASTPSPIAAQNFAKSVGVILSLKCASKYIGDVARAPKYLSVSWLSDFPNEEEKLFYGSFVAFAIHDIVEASTMTRHADELKMLNKLQNVVENEEWEWSIDEVDWNQRFEARRRKKQQESNFQAIELYEWLDQQKQKEQKQDNL